MGFTPLGQRAYDRGVGASHNPCIVLKRLASAAIIVVAACNDHQGDGPIAAASPARVLQEFGAAPIKLTVALRAPGDFEAELEQGQGYPYLTFRADGRIVLPRMTSLEIWSPKGGLLATIGRRGSGPGEFQRIAAVCMARGDTTVVWDVRLRRVSIFDANDHFVSSFGLAAGHVGESACLANGLLVTQRYETPSGRRAERVLVIEGRALSGAVQQVITRVAVPWVDSEFPAEAIAVAHANQVFVYDGVSPRIGIVDIPAGRSRALLASVTEEPITKEARQQRRAAHSRLGRTAGYSIGTVSSIDKQLPNWPWIAGMSVASDGSIWLRPYPRSFGAPEVWTGYDTSGAHIGRLELQRADDGLSVSRIVRMLTRDSAVVRITLSDGTRLIGIRALARPPA